MKDKKLAVMMGWHTEYKYTSNIHKHVCPDCTSIFLSQEEDQADNAFNPEGYVDLNPNTHHLYICFHPNWVFPDCNSSLNTPMGMKLCALLFFKIIYQIARSDGIEKTLILIQIVFPDCNSSLNSLMVMK